MKNLWIRIVAECGAVGLAALAVVGMATLFYVYWLKPLEQAAAAVDRDLERAVRSARLREPSRAPSSSRGIEGFYAFFDRSETSTDWLAKLHGAALSSGVVIRTAEYKVIESKMRVERYQLTAPVIGGYAQIRSFIDGALAEIPVLSLDQVRMRRTRTGTDIEAELVFSIYERRQ